MKTVRSTIILAMFLVMCPLAWSHSGDGVPSGDRGHGFSGLPVDAPPTNVAIFQDNDPWGQTSSQNILTAHAIPFTILGSAVMATADLTPFDKVVIASQQSIAFYTALSTNRARFDAYVNSGGVLQFHGASYYSDDWSALPMPGGLIIDPQSDTTADNALTIADVANPLVTTPNLLDDVMIDGWNSSTHSYFTGASVAFSTVITEDEFNQPVLIEFAVGMGGVIATMMTVEWSGADQRVLENLLLGQPDVVQIPTLGKTGLAIFIGAFVLLGLVFVSKKRLS